MDLKGVSTGLIVTLLAALILTHAANSANASELKPSGLNRTAGESQWLVARPVERIDKMHAPPPPRAVLEINRVSFEPRWAPIAAGLPIKIFVVFTNKGPPDSITSEFRIYLSHDGQVLEKRRPSLTKGLPGGRASSTDFQITLPDKPGRHCWEASLRQTDDGLMILGPPKVLCAVVKAKPMPKVAR